MPSAAKMQIVFFEESPFLRFIIYIFIQNKKESKLGLEVLKELATPSTAHFIIIIVACNSVTCG